MTKRKIKSHGPTGHNKHLGNSLVNTHKVQSKNQKNPNILEEEEPTKVIDSITHESNLTEFLTNAELAGTNFEAERGDIRVLSKHESSIVQFDDLKTFSLDELNRNFGHLLSIPRRPHHSLYRTVDELHAVENETFLNWKRNLCLLSEGSDVVLTPFERNLELWRQLWRVIERSHVVVQIVDARNPLMFRSADLEAYVSEVDPRKRSLLLVNKSDLLTPEQIQSWHDYFVAHNIHAIFWSATQSAEQSSNDDDGEKDAKEVTDKKDGGSDGASTESLDGSDSGDEAEDDADTICDGVRGVSICREEGEKKAGGQQQKFTFIRTAEELLRYLKEQALVAAGPDVNAVVVGMVGYPNVGKSSTINCLIGEKKTSVSATPGKTKHFQTLIIDDVLTLCDCPGLVMPSFGFSNSEMILNCVLPIHNMRDFFSPTKLLCTRVPRCHFEALYSVLLPRPAAHEPASRPPTAHELLTTVAFMKGFMSSAGIPDCSRSARMILRDVVDGRLKWVASPPGVPQSTFDEWTYARQFTGANAKRVGEYGENLLQQLDKRNLIINDSSMNTRIDRAFFGVKSAGARTRGAINPSAADPADTRPASKKHGNRNKREKARRLFGHLDA